MRPDKARSEIVTCLEGVRPSKTKRGVSVDDDSAEDKKNSLLPRSNKLESKDEMYEGMKQASERFRRSPLRK